MCTIEQERRQGRDYDRQAIVMSLLPPAIVLLLWPGAQPLTIGDEFCELAIGRRRFVLAERISSETVQSASLKLFTSVLFPLSGLSSYQTDRPCPSANPIAAASASP